MNTMIIVDGHNLIPHVRGISLEDMDDEQRLVALLGRYARERRVGKGGAKPGGAKPGSSKPRRIEVFFDKAPPGQAGRRVYGSVTAHFVPETTTADLAIHQFVSKLGGAAKNATVVSSDREVQNRALRAQAAVVSSEEFARQLAELPGPGQGAPGTPAAPPLGEWLDLFGLDPHEAEKPIEIQPLAKPKKPARSKPSKRARHGFPPKK